MNSSVLVCCVIETMLSWLNKRRATKIAHKEDRNPQTKRQRLIFPRSLFDSYFQSTGIENVNYVRAKASLTESSVLTRPSDGFSRLVEEYKTEYLNKRTKYGFNKIRTTKYTLLSFLPKNLFEQFHRLANFYFLMIIGLNFVPAVNAFGKEVSMIPLLAVLTLQGLKDGYEDYIRYRNDKKINSSTIDMFDR